MLGTLRRMTLADLRTRRCGACRRRCRSGTRASTAPALGARGTHAVADAGGRLVSMWGVRPPRRGAGHAACAAYRAAGRPGLARTAAATPTRPAFPDLAPHVPLRRPHAARDGRPVGPARRGQPTTSAPGSTTACGPRPCRRCNTARCRRRRRRHAARRLPLRARRRRRRARDRGRPGARRHHRARALPLLGRRREGAAAGSSTWATCTRASSAASPNCRRCEAHRLAGRVSGDSTVAYAWAYCMALESAWRLRDARARARGCAR